MRRLQGLGIALDKLGQVGGVSGDAGILQLAGLFQVIIQGGLVILAADGEFRYQQRIEALRRERPLGQVRQVFRGGGHRFSVGLGGGVVGTGCEQREAEDNGG